jgi:hypothetical protein
MMIGEFLCFIKITGISGALGWVVGTHNTWGLAVIGIILQE